MGMNFAGLNQSALGRVVEILQTFLPGGEIIGQEYKCADVTGGKGRSMSVNIKTGVWGDFSTGQMGGDLIALIAEQRGVSMADAYNALADHLGYTNGNGASSPAAAPKKQTEKISAPPSDVAPPKFSGAHWTYRDFDGRPMFFIERVDDPGGKKQFFPTSWSESSGGWVRKIWPGMRPLYGLELLTSRPNAPVLIVEGEKACDAARTLCQSYVVVTWSGGSKAVNKTDFAPIFGHKKVLLWPDADPPGIEAMYEIATQLLDRVDEIKMINTDYLAPGFDAADFAEEGTPWAPWAKQRAKLLLRPSSPQPPADPPTPTEREAPVIPERNATPSPWPGPFGFYDTVENEKTGNVRFVPMYDELAKWCFENKNMCFTDKEQLKYDGKKWEWLQDLELANLLVKWNRGYLQPAHHHNFVKQIKARCFTKALGIDPDLAVGHLNVTNGIVRISDGALLPHDYRFRFKHCSPIVYDPNAECPRWERYLLDTFQEDLELIDLVDRLFGYILMGGRPFLHKAFVLLGDGRNGKSTFIDVMRAVIGKEAYSGVSMSKLDKEFSLVALDGKLANICEETPNDAINAEVFKTIVGGGEITAAYKGFDEFQFRVDARFIFACNDMPIFKDRSVGLIDRLVFIPFNRYLPEEERDTLILDKLMAELPGILNRAIRAAKTMATERSIPKYEVIGQSSERYKRESDSLYSWFLDEIEIDGAAPGIPVDVAYKRYKHDMGEDGNHAVAKIKFSKAIRKHISAAAGKLGAKYDPNLKSRDRSERVLSSIRFRTVRDGKGEKMQSEFPV